MSTIDTTTNTATEALKVYFCIASGTHSESMGAGRAGQFYFFAANKLPSSITSPNDADYKLWYGSFVFCGEATVSHKFDPAQMAELTAQAAAAEVDALREQISKVYAAAEAKAKDLRGQIDKLLLLAAPTNPAPCEGEIVGESDEAANNAKTVGDAQDGDFPF